jgi:hypothetical protein
VKEPLQQQGCLILKGANNISRVLFWGEKSGFFHRVLLIN